MGMFLAGCKLLFYSVLRGFPTFWGLDINSDAVALWAATANRGCREKNGSQPGCFCSVAAKTVEKE